MRNSAASFVIDRYVLKHPTGAVIVTPRRGETS
jgi:hypothetical protein